MIAMRLAGGIRSIVALLAVALPFAGWAQMVAANDRVRVEVRVETRSEHKDLKNTSVDTVTQRKVLDIMLNGRTREVESRLIRWTIYGRNLRTNNTTPIESGEIKLALDGAGRQRVESKRVSTTFTPEHSVVSNSRGRGRTYPKAKRVEATGSKYIGYRVQVFDGGRVVGDASDPVGIGGIK